MFQIAPASPAARNGMLLFRQCCRKFRAACTADAGGGRVEVRRRAAWSGAVSRVSRAHGNSSWCALCVQARFSQGTSLLMWMACLYLICRPPKLLPWSSER